MNTPVFPTRHGDWHLIDGHLVDVSQRAADIPEHPEPSPAATPTATSTSSLPPASPKRRNKSSSED